MYNPIQEKRNEICNNIAKSFGNGSEPEDIEKAKWQIGEVRVDSKGVAHECYEYTAEGKPRLRRVKKNKGASTDDSKSKKNDVTIQAKIDEARKNGFSLYSDGKKEITITKREDLHDRSKNYYDVRFRVRNEKGDNFTQDETIKVNSKELTESYIKKLAKEKFSDKKDKDESEIADLIKKVNSTKNKSEINEKVFLSGGFKVKLEHSYDFKGVPRYKLYVEDTNHINQSYAFNVDGNELSESFINGKINHVKDTIKKELENEKVVKELDKLTKTYYVEGFKEDEKNGILWVNLSGKGYGDNHHDEASVKFDALDKVNDNDMYKISSHLKGKYKSNPKFKRVHFSIYLD